ncbi:steryl ester hydrolase, putative [Plasmodium chabaudi chabaudi]|uniref:Steryl ester hydrolase, putative n=1 Tax=Plasmodium chabaudi chabaudi TaxID=31271 RepID=A0A1D3RW37_PLACU|nr:steryl ester hydrolase, putative [Plasmodium chabaudi chabaudi]
MALNTLNDGLPIANANITPMFNEVQNDSYDLDFINEDSYNDDWRKPLPYDLFNKLGDLDDMERAVLEVTDGDYKVEKHHVYTVDGYKLNLYHIVESDKNFIPLKKKNPKKGVFCIGHGLMESSINAISGGYNSLPFKLFFKNYDIWLCNNRGNYLTEYVGKKYAMKKNLEQYTIQDLRDIGFDENAYSESSEYEVGNLKKKKKKKKLKKNDSKSKKNNQGQPNLTENKSHKNKKETSNTNLQHKTTQDCQSNEDDKEPIVGETSKSGIKKQDNLASSADENVENVENDENVENVENDEVTNLESMLENNNLFDSCDIDIKKIYELAGITEEDLKYLDDMKKKDIEENINETDEWTFEDMGKKDIPAIIKYIKTKTKQDKIKYIGLSQGSMSFLVGACVNPYVNNSIDRCYLMSLPIILWKKSDIFFALKVFINISKHFKTIVKLRKYAMDHIPKKLHKRCIIDLSHYITSNVLKFVRNDPYNKDVYYLNTPSGSNSDANMQKWLSSFNKDKPVTDIFEKNNKQCTIPICLIYGDKDCIVDASSSIEYMQQIFQNNELKIIKNSEWSHLDPMAADTDDIIFSHIMKDMKNDNSQKKKKKI